MIADEEERPVGPIVAQKCGRSLLLGSIYHIVQHYLMVSINCILFDIIFRHTTLISKTLKTVRVK